MPVWFLSCRRSFWLRLGCNKDLCCCFLLLHLLLMLLLNLQERDFKSKAMNVILGKKGYRL